VQLLWRRIEVTLVWCMVRRYDWYVSFSASSGRPSFWWWYRRLLRGRTSFLLGLQSKGCGAFSERFGQGGFGQDAPEVSRFSPDSIKEKMRTRADSTVTGASRSRPSSSGHEPRLDSQAMPTHSNFSHCFNGVSLTVWRSSA